MATLMCYNRGCGKDYNPRDNPNGACTFHPGAPFFHEGYKGWTCCESKTSDFTEFLNTKGCTQGKHSHERPEEPEHITGNLRKEHEPDEVLEVRAPLRPSALARPDFGSAALARLKPTIAPSLRQQMCDALAALDGGVGVEGGRGGGGGGRAANDDGAIKDGEPCKNGGCKTTYSGPDSDCDPCLFHPGVPIFHEGMKFWSCCQRKTTDFQSFLDQEGCDRGKHKWKKDAEGSAKVECRYDWHQTATTVTVAIYCKKYDPDRSKVELNPVRLKVHIYFPEQAGAFDLDLELKGVVCVSESSVGMMGTKAEIKMKKAEPESWTKLNIPPQPLAPQAGAAAPADEVDDQPIDLDDLGLDDIAVEQRRWKLSDAASGKEGSLLDKVRAATGGQAAERNATRFEDITDLE